MTGRRFAPGRDCGPIPRSQSRDRPARGRLGGKVLRSGAAILLRRARGYAPAPLALPGVLKDPALRRGPDEEHRSSRLRRSRRLEPPYRRSGWRTDPPGFHPHNRYPRRLCGARFATVACDKHPDYASSHYAEDTGCALCPCNITLPTSSQCSLNTANPQTQSRRVMGRNRLR